MHCPSVNPYIYLSVCLLVDQSVYPSDHLSIHLSVSTCVYVYIYRYVCIYTYIYLHTLWSFYASICLSICPSTSSTAQGGGGSFKLGNLSERLVAVNHGWQSEPTHGRKGGWICVFLEWLQWLHWSPHPQLMDVLWCSAAVIVVVVWLRCSCGVV